MILVCRLTGNIEWLYLFLGEQSLYVVLIDILESLQFGSQARHEHLHIHCALAKSMYAEYVLAAGKFSYLSKL